MPSAGSFSTALDRAAIAASPASPERPPGPAASCVPAVEGIQLHRLVRRRLGVLHVVRAQQHPRHRRLREGLVPDVPAPGPRCPSAPRRPPARASAGNTSARPPAARRVRALVRAASKACPRPPPSLVLAQEGPGHLAEVLRALQSSRPAAARRRRPCVSLGEEDDSTQALPLRVIRRRASPRGSTPLPPAASGPCASAPGRSP